MFFNKKKIVVGEVYIRYSGAGWSGWYWINIYKNKYTIHKGEIQVLGGWYPIENAVFYEDVDPIKIAKKEIEKNAPCLHRRFNK